LPKDGPAEQLVSAVRVVARDDALFVPGITCRLIAEFSRSPYQAAASDKPDVLTGRELEVLKLIARGLNNAEIARELYVAETTVRTHLGHILAKLDLRDRVQLSRSPTRPASHGRRTHEVQGGNHPSAAFAEKMGPGKRCVLCFRPTNFVMQRC